MSYSRRISFSMLAAAALVAGMVAAAPGLLRRIDAIALAPIPEHAIRLNLNDLEPAAPSPKPEPVRRLVDAGAPAAATRQDTDLISSAASRAQDHSEQEGDPNRPAAQEIDEFDQLGASATPVEPAPPVVEVAPSAAEPAPESSPRAAEPEPSTEPVPSKKEAGSPAEDREVGQAAKPAETSAEAERFQVARAEPAPRLPVQELRAEKGREAGGAVESGFTSFEANKHALGEYMLTVRNRVERSWRTALHLRYTGASRTDAVIHCVIRPDGTLEAVTIVDAGSSLTYAVLCREAVEDAGPFAPFPFDVPEIYRSDNLEINWKFSYL